MLAMGMLPFSADAASSKEIQKQIDGLKSKKAELQKEIEELKLQNLRLAVENEYIKKLNALVTERRRKESRK